MEPPVNLVNFSPESVWAHQMSLAANILAFSPIHLSSKTLFWSSFYYKDSKASKTIPGVRTSGKILGFSPGLPEYNK